MSSLQPLVYLPCELTARDLASRLAIANHAIKAGYPVVLGQQWSMFTNLKQQAPRGCILFTTANTFQARPISQLSEAGCVVLVSDQEALPFIGDGLLANVAQESMAACDGFLAQSAAHKDILVRAYPDAADKIVVVGSPRLGILETAHTERPFAAPYILFNTNFALVNSIWGSEEKACAVLLGGGGMDADEVTRRLQIERAAHEQINRIISWAVAHSGLQVVVRPHPAENAGTWHAAAPGATVVPKSEPLPWLQHAKVVIHCDSTTGLEAAYLNVPCLNLSLSPDWSRQFIMHQVNHTVTSADDGIACLESYLKSGAWPRPAVNAADWFPRAADATTAKAMLARLPPPAHLGKFKWSRMERRETQRDKFTVTQQDIAGRTQARIVELDDSLFLLMP